jgi:peptidoglycan/LPS O-acetylase OafA/YrhL
MLDTTNKLELLKIILFYFIFPLVNPIFGTRWKNILLLVLYPIIMFAIIVVRYCIYNCYIMLYQFYLIMSQKYHC